MKTFVVTDQNHDWFEIRDTTVLTARRYLIEPEGGNGGAVQVLNLCRTGRYQGRGYYVSLLAEARGQRPVADVKTIENLRSEAFVQTVAAELQPMVRESLSDVEGERFQLDIYLGMHPGHDALAAQLFEKVRAPLLRVLFVQSEGGWRLDGVHAIGLADIPLQNRALLLDAVRAFLCDSQAPERHAADTSRPRLAVLWDPNEPQKPSNEEALQRFLKAAPLVGMDAELIGPDALERLPEFDGLFNRASPGEAVIYEFLRRAEALGMPVVDDPESVLKCGNKVYMQELLNRHGIATPRTLIVHRSNVDEVIPALGLPCVLKLPDSGFGLDVVKIESEGNLRKETERLFENSELLIAQEWLPSDFDWRVGVYDRRPLFAAKYFMAPGHWKIIKLESEGEPAEGKTEATTIGEVPEQVISTALRAANLIGRGLYGADLKQVGDRIYLIEVNINPNIDAGNEDQVLGDGLYREIMGVFARRIAETRGGAAQQLAA
ncbi:RimK family protein [soil metagenome]